MSEKIEHTGRDEEHHRLLLVAILLIVVQVIIICVAYPFVPAQMPLSWNTLGQVSDYGPKLEALCFPPAMSLFVLLLVRGLTALGPYPGQENKRVAIQFTNYIITAVIVLMLLIQLSIIAISLHVPIDIISVTSIAISLILIGMGNYMGKLRRNFYIGIKTPWTISDDTIWERTHRLGGWLVVAAGVIGLITAFIPSAPIKLAGLLIPLLLAVIITMVYSYIEYQKLHAKSF